MRAGVAGRRGAVLLTALALLPVVAAAEAAPPRLVNARVETRAVPSGLGDAVSGIVRSSAGPLWIGYAAPVEGRHQMCCWDPMEGVGRDGRCPGCRLEGKGAFTFSDSGGPVNLEGDTRFVVLLRAEGGRIGRIRSLSYGCAIDAGGLPVHWLTEVAPAESVRLLATFVGRAEDGRKKGVGDGALSAIAFHADPSADTVMEGFTRADRSVHVRKQAAFWLGNARGRKGYEILARMVKDDPSDDVRSHVTFALSQSEVPEALDAMIRAARHDPSTHVRGQALFWLAQKAGQKATSTITRALEDDPETAVKEKAVFALSQLPKDQGVPLLINVARTNRNPEVRRKAMFWLGQSNDARALAFIEDVLRK